MAMTDVGRSGGRVVSRRGQGGSVFRSFIDDVLKDMDREERKQRNSAAKYASEKIRSGLYASARLYDLRKEVRKLGAKIPGMPGMGTGELAANIDYYTGKKASYAGAFHPARHAHLLEFGHKNADGSMTPAYPFIRPTLEAEADNLVKIMSEEWRLEGAKTDVRHTQTGRGRRTNWKKRGL